MAFIFADRVKESSSTLGLIDFILDGAVTGSQTFIAGVGATNQCFYTIVHDTAGSWEAGIATIAAPNILQRTTVQHSSNSDNPVNFSAGAKTVFSGPSAEAFIERITTLQHAAIDHQVGVTGVPAPEAFTSAVHAGVSHAGLPGVPSPEAFTSVVHAGTSHVGLSGIPVISAPAPQTYNVNRVSASTPVDLTSTTDGIHYISLDVVGNDFDTLRVDIPPTPTDATPFLVIFNEDVNLKGAVLSIFAGSFSQLASLNPRDGVRLWHMGVLGTEWQVEKIRDSDFSPAEVFYRYSGDINALASFFYAYNNGVNTAGARVGGEADNFVMSQTRFLHLSYRAQGTGVGNTNLSILDETAAVLETPVLTTGLQTESVSVDFTVEPNVSGSPVDNGSFALRYDSGGDKFDTYLVLYGYQRDGGHELQFSGTKAGVGDLVAWCSPSQNTTTVPSSQADSQYRLPNSGFIDRIVIVAASTSTCDLDLNIGGATAVTVPMITTAGVARMHQLSEPVAVAKNTLLSLETRNWTVAPGFFRISVRLRGIRGGLIQFSGDQTGALGLFDHADNLGGAVPDTTFVVPRDMRLLRWSISSGHTFTVGDTVDVRRNGAIVSKYDPTGGGSDVLQIVEAGGISFSAGQLITVQINGYNSATTVLLHMTAEPLTLI